MLASPKPKTLKELIQYLQEEPNLIIKTSFTRKNIRFEKFKDGCFSFDEQKYNFCLHSGKSEIGITIGENGFTAHRESSNTNFLFTTGKI